MGCVPFNSWNLFFEGGCLDPSLLNPKPTLGPGRCNYKQWDRHSAPTHSTAPPPPPRSQLPPTTNPTCTAPQNDLDQLAGHTKDIALDTGCATSQYGPAFTSPQTRGVLFLLDQAQVSPASISFNPKTCFRAWEGFPQGIFFVHPHAFGGCRCEETPESFQVSPFDLCVFLSMQNLFCQVEKPLCCYSAPAHIFRAPILLCFVLCCAVLCYALLCPVVSYSVVWCCVVLCCVALRCVALCCVVLCCVVLCCVVLCCGVVWCVVLCCAQGAVTRRHRP